MKKIALALVIASLTACGTSKNNNASTVKDETSSSTGNSTETYLMAKNVAIESQQTARNGQTTLALAYDLPCWASPVALVDVLDIQGSPLNPAANFAIAAGVLVKGNLMIPCVGSTRKTVSKTVNTNAVEGRFLGIKVVNAGPTSESNPLYFAAENINIDTLNQLTSGETQLTLSYDLPCWASAVVPVPLFDALHIQGSPFNPAADFAIAVGVIVKGNPMVPCVNTTRKTATKTINTNAVEGSFRGFRIVKQ